MNENINASEVEVYRAEYEALKERVALINKREAEEVIKETERFINELGKSLYKYREPILQQKVAIETDLEKAQRNNDTKKTDELQKQLEGLNIQLEKVGKDKNDIKKLLGVIKNLELEATSITHSSGRYAESIKVKSDYLNQRLEGILKHGSHENQHGGYGGFLSSAFSYSTYLRAVKRILPFSSN